MEEIKINGIVLTSYDYKEKDKLVEIFSPELGKIIAVLKGCKAPSAKLKFAFQPFCFAEFELMKNGKFYQIKTASQIESFFNITKDLDKYYLASLLSELVQVSTAEEEQNPALFLSLINSLKYLCYDSIAPELITLKFCVDLLANLGYKTDYKKCSSCKMDFTQKVYLNLDTGGFVCNICKTDNCLVISNAGLSAIKMVDNTERERLGTLKLGSNILKEGIKAICTNLEYRLYKKIRAIKFI